MQTGSPLRHSCWATSSQAKPVVPLLPPGGHSRTLQALPFPGRSSTAIWWTHWISWSETPFKQIPYLPGGDGLGVAVGLQRGSLEFHSPGWP